MEVMEKKLHEVHVEWQRIKDDMNNNAAKIRAMEVALEEARRQADKERSLRLIAEAKDDKLTVSIVKTVAGDRRPQDPGKWRRA
ncbi:hypothetical protein AAFF_G00290950 [Aldrovandia affinis]|uniref:Uncharacterized protein n=1 Tax=Aldrovandia affinis TaxID=143900 RepID=A0AAD7R9C3_9TELE|nr:hypothetical protein AAFF_G00290950 [Aldrovandia affinis]